MQMTDFESADTRITLDSIDYNVALSNVVRNAGTAGFYRNLAVLLAHLTCCRNYLVLRYTPYGAPTFLVNEALSEDSVKLYLDSLYGIDPLYELARKNREPRVVSLRSLGQDAPADKRYLRELFKSFFIFDELAILLPVPGGVSIAVCCERQRVKFGPADRHIVETILPVIESLHKLHVDRAFALASTRSDPEESGQQIAFLVLDDSGRVVRESSHWRQLELTAGSQVEILAKALVEPEGEAPLAEDFVVRWEGLSADFPLAPNGKIVTIERRTNGTPQLSFEDGLRTFRARWQLTGREAEIVRLILVGYPNSLIARSLGIGLGTVRNHRHRLYNKLDITTERELFSMFLSQIIGKDIAPLALAEA